MYLKCFEFNFIFSHDKCFNVSNIVAGKDLINPSAG
jgi:hypothetical protein